MSIIIKKGREFTDPPLLGNYLHKTKNNRIVLLRGKFKGAYLDTIPVGYIGQFLLTQCHNDMTPKEIELCELYAGDAVMKKIRRKIKMTKKSKVQVEVIAGKGIAEAFDIAAKHGCAEISFTIPVPNNYKKPTVFDKLRTRGTPLELISSYIVSNHVEMARTILQGCVLEALYEQLIEKYDAICTFENTVNYTSEYGLRTLTLETDYYGIGFNEKEKEFIKNNPHKTCLTSIDLKDQKYTVTDTLQTVILKSIQDILQDIEQTIDNAINDFRIQTDEQNKPIFVINPELSMIHLRTSNEHAQVYVTGHIALYATRKIEN